jgi:hypothetical protein
MLKKCNLESQLVKVSFKYLLFLITCSSLFSCTLQPDLLAIESQLMPYKKPVVTSISPNNVFTGGGTEITIEGENLDPGVSIKINNKSCQIKKLIGNTKVICSVPASNEGSYPVIITGLSGESVSAGIEYDALSFTNLSLVIGKLTGPSPTNADGFFSNADSRGATQLVVEGNVVYSADLDGHKIKKTTLTNLQSQTVIGRGINSTGNIAVSNPIDAGLSNPSCLAKTSLYLYFCITDIAIGRMELANSALTVIAGHVSADVDVNNDPNVYPADNPLGEKFNSIRKIFLKDNFMYIVDRDTIKRINLNNQFFETVAGTAGNGTLADGNGTAGTFDTIENAELLGDKLYVTDSVDSYVIRSIDLSSGGNFAVTTILGDPLVYLGYYDEAVDGVGSAGQINDVMGMTIYKDQLMVIDEFASDNKLKIRLFNPTNNEITTKFTLVTDNKHVLGNLSSKARVRYNRTRGAKYIENYGLLLGTEAGLLRIQ